jgi:predicted DNA repair protein MutK
VIVAIGITALVYGIVGLIVKMDDGGLLLSQRSSPTAQKIGVGLVRGMPRLLSVVSVVGIAAMIWVGGHILLVGTDDLGWHGPYELVHHLETAAHDAVEVVGGLLGWVVNTGASALVGLLVGAVAVTVMQLLPFGHGKPASEAPHTDGA